MWVCIAPGSFTHSPAQPAKPLHTASLSSTSPPYPRPPPARPAAPLPCRLPRCLASDRRRRRRCRAVCPHRRFSAACQTLSKVNIYIYMYVCVCVCVCVCVLYVQPCLLTRWPQKTTTARIRRRARPRGARSGRFVSVSLPVSVCASGVFVCVCVSLSLFLSLSLCSVFPHPVCAIAHVTPAHRSTRRSGTTPRHGDRGIAVLVCLCMHFTTKTLLLT
jgi:hypothetical protein